MRLGDDDEGPEGALIIGFGSKGGSEGPRLMRSLAKALSQGDWGKAWSVFEEANRVCVDEDDAYDEREEKDRLRRRDRQRDDSEGLDF